MPRHKNLLIVITDAGHARFVRPEAENILRTEWLVDLASAHKKSADLGSDRPGASFHSDSTAHHALAPRHDPHELEKEKFARYVAQEINGLPVDDFDALVIVAPPHCLSIILEALDAPAQAKLIGTLSKDLVKTPDDALWAHLLEFITPVVLDRHI